MTTQTFTGADATSTSTSGDDNGDNGNDGDDNSNDSNTGNDDDGAGVRTLATMWTVLVVTGMAVVYNGL